MQKKKSQFLKRETTKIEEKRKNINTENKGYLENETPFQLQSLNNQEWKDKIFGRNGSKINRAKFHI